MIQTPNDVCVRKEQVSLFIDCHCESFLCALLEAIYNSAESRRWEDFIFEKT